MNNEYDLVLLDVMLPEVDGFTICRELRKTRKALDSASAQIKTVFKKGYKLEVEQ